MLNRATLSEWQSFPLTPGQFDLLNGTNSEKSVDDNIIYGSLYTSGHVSENALKDASNTLADRYSALRAKADGHGGLQRTRQVIRDDPEASVYSAPAREADTREGVQKQLDEAIAQIAREIDIKDGPTWGSAIVKESSGTHIVLAFNHFVSDFYSISRYMRSLVRYLSGSKQKGVTDIDMYTEYLTDLKSKSCSVDLALSKRIIGEIKDYEYLRGTDSTTLLMPDTCTKRIVNLDQATGSGLTEFKVYSALASSLCEIFDVGRVRIDTTALNRSSSNARKSGGWLAHAIPRFASDASANTEHEFRQWTADWQHFFPEARRQVPTEVALRGHAFLNFFGSYNPKAWRCGAYSLSESQPTYVRQQKHSVTPIHLEVHRVNRCWELTWRAADTLVESGDFNELIESVSDRLTMEQP